MSSPLVNAPSFAATTALARNSKATRVLLVEDNESEALLVRSALAGLRDDGRGFDVTAAMKSPETDQKLGLLGMKERVALVGGGLSIESAERRGTTLYVRIPIPAHENGEVA
jgi:signal transduction histidine kinase